jgi:hypothetical protein
VRRPPMKLSAIAESLRNAGLGVIKVTVFRKLVILPVSFHLRAVSFARKIVPFADNMSK